MLICFLIPNCSVGSACALPSGNQKKKNNVKFLNYKIQIATTSVFLIGYIILDLEDYFEINFHAGVMMMEKQ